MWEESNVLAIFLADIHLSLKPPIWRSSEPDWLHAQARPLLEVRSLQEKHKCPVICAGDVFDRSVKISDGWNAQPELINFAIRELPDDMYAIPGQHDLPNHQYSDIHRSAYWTLVEAGKIENIPPKDIVHIGGDIDCRPLDLCSFPPGYVVGSYSGCGSLHKDSINIAVVHDYVWIGGYSYPNASANSQLCRKTEQLEEYDIVVYGDNHKGFSYDTGTTQVFNCGTLMRRKSDEIDYQPQVGLLLESGRVVPYRLDTSEDKHIVMSEQVSESSLDMDGFFDELEKLGKTSLDFVEAMKNFMRKNKTPNEVKEVIFNAMEK